MKKDDGSIVLEATIILPFFVAFIIALAVMVQVASMQIALQSSVNEATKQIATHYAPVYGLQKKIEAIPAKVTGAIYDQISNPIADLFFAGAVDDLKKYLTQTATRMVETATIDMSQGYVQKLTQNLAEENGLKGDQVKLIQYSLPHDKSKLCQVRAQYTFKLPIPFFSRTVTLEAQAVEYAWIGE